MSDSERIKRVEETILLLKDLTINHSGRMDDFLTAVENERHERKESRKDFDFKLNASKELRESSRELKEASQAQLKRIEMLENN
jgi:hypothetical protein